MREVYRTIKGYGEDEVIINKSKFIGYSSPINSEEDALEFIEKIKTKHRDATHNVYAYVLGAESNVQRFSDDGEPSGTAGIPVLEVIKKEDLRNLVVVVTRYFGGIKLGGGGLIRAYTRGAKIALDAGILVDMTLHSKIKMTISYTLLGKIENFLITNGLKTEEVNYKEDVEIILYIIDSDSSKFEKEMLNLTNGTVILSYLDKAHLPLVNGTRV